MNQDMSEAHFRRAGSWRNAVDLTDDEEKAGVGEIGDGERGDAEKADAEAEAAVDERAAAAGMREEAAAVDTRPSPNASLSPKALNSEQ